MNHCLRFWYRDKVCFFDSNTVHCKSMLASFVACFWDLTEHLDPETMMTSSSSVTSDLIRFTEINQPSQFKRDIIGHHV